MCRRRAPEGRLQGRLQGLPGLVLSLCCYHLRIWSWLGIAAGPICITWQRHGGGARPRLAQSAALHVLAPVSAQAGLRAARCLPETEIELVLTTSTGQTAGIGLQNGLQPCLYRLSPRHLRFRAPLSTGAGRLPRTTTASNLSDGALLTSHAHSFRTRLETSSLKPISWPLERSFAVAQVFRGRP